MLKSHKYFSFLSLFLWAGVCLPVFAAEISDAGIAELENKADYIYVEELGQRIAVFPTVFRPDPLNEIFRRMLAETDLSKALNVLEIGTGSGVNGLIALKSGAGHVVATDINETAVLNSGFNAGLLGLDSRFETRLVPMSDTGAFSVMGTDEKFDLVLFNPPWFNSRPENISEYALYDEGYSLHRSFVTGLARHLTDNGKAWVELGHRKAVELFAEEAELSNLDLKILRQTRLGRVEYTILELTRRRT